MRGLLVAAALALEACASTPAPVMTSALPPRVDVARLVPAADAKPIESVGERFEDIPIDGGRYCPADDPKHCRDLPPGILIDETSHAQATADASEVKRLRLENGALWSVRTAERQAAEDAERLYRERIAEQGHELERMRTRWVPLAAAMAGALVVLVGIEIFSGSGPEAGGASSGPASGR